MNRNIKKVLKVFCMFISHDQQVLTTKKLQNYIELIEVPIFQLRKVCFKKKKKFFFMMDSITGAGSTDFFF